MFDSIFPNRFKEDDESPIVENDSLEDGVAALEITQAEGRSYPGISNKPFVEGLLFKATIKSLLMMAIEYHL